MKKLLIGFAFFSLIVIALPAKAKETVQPDCTSVRITCANGNGAMGIVCSQSDLDFYLSYYCGN